MMVEKAGRFLEGLKVGHFPLIGIVYQQEFPAEGLGCLWRIGISRFSIRIASLRALCLERGQRVGGDSDFMHSVQ